MKLYTIILRHTFIRYLYSQVFIWSFMTFSLLQLLYQYFGLRLDLSLGTNIKTLKNTHCLSEAVTQTIYHILYPRSNIYIAKSTFCYRNCFSNIRIFTIFNIGSGLCLIQRVPGENPRYKRSEMGTFSAHETRCKLLQ